VLAYLRRATAVMTEATLLPFDLPAVHRKKLTVDFAGGNQSSDGGLLLLREAERKLGVCQRLAEAMPDRRDQSRIRHEMTELIMARAAAITCGYKDGKTTSVLGPILPGLGAALPVPNSVTTKSPAGRAGVVNATVPAASRSAANKCTTL